MVKKKVEEEDLAKFAFLGMDARAGLRNAKNLVHLEGIYPQKLSGTKDIVKLMRDNAVSLLERIDAPESLIEDAREAPIDKVDGILEKGLVETANISPGSAWEEVRKKLEEEVL